MGTVDTAPSYSRMLQSKKVANVTPDKMLEKMSLPLPSLLTETYILQNWLQKCRSAHLVVDLNLATHQNVRHSAAHISFSISCTHVHVSHISHVPSQAEPLTHTHTAIRGKSLQKSHSAPPHTLSTTFYQRLKQSTVLTTSKLFFSTKIYSNLTQRHILYPPEEVTTHLSNDKSNPSKEARWHLIAVAFQFCRGNLPQIKIIGGV